jgi:hypothetical protein
MNLPSQDPLAERVAASILAIFFAFFGWFDLVQGGIALKGRSGHISFVDGWVGIAVAGLAFLVAAFGVSILLRTFKASRSTHYFGWVIMLLPPVFFILFRH